MDVRQRLTADLKTAMKSGDTETRDTLRLMLAAVKQVEVDDGAALDDAGVVAVLTKQAKQRRESITAYEAGGRGDLAVTEKAELAIIERYLPQMLSRAAVEEAAAAKIAELGVTDVKGMGRVMSALMSDLQGQADGKLVSDVVRKLLTAS